MNGECMRSGTILPESRNNSRTGRQGVGLLGLAMGHSYGLLQWNPVISIIKLTETDMNLCPDRDSRPIRYASSSC
jgi:hypothetical protein